MAQMNDDEFWLVAPPVFSWNDTFFRSVLFVKAFLAKVVTRLDVLRSPSLSWPT